MGGCPAREDLQQAEGGKEEGGGKGGRRDGRGGEGGRRCYNP